MQQGTQAADGAAPPLLMVVDDDDLLREAMAMTLQTHGFRVLEHASAATALQALNTGNRPDLIVLDLWMPEMDGWQFRERQLADDTLANIPVVVMSADQSRGATISAAAFVAKPMVQHDLVQTISKVLDAGGSRDEVAGVKRTIRAANRRRMSMRPRRAGLRRVRQRALALGVRAEQVRGWELALVSRAVSHVVNNTLQGLLGYAQFAGHECCNEDLQRSVVDGALRCAAVLTKFADCVQPERAEPAHGALDALDGQLVETWRRLCPPGTTLDISNLDPLRGLRVTAGALCAMVGELIANAAEASRENDGCHVQLRVEVAPRTLAQLQCALPLCNRQPGLWCSVSVSDSGQGVPLSDLHRIWSPFFSTRFPGRGLGLSLVLARMAALGGLVEAEARPLAGLTVRLMFPLAAN